MPKPVVERACNLHTCPEVTEHVVSVSLTEEGQDIPPSNTIGSVLKPADMSGPAYPIADDNDENIFLGEGEGDAHEEGSQDSVVSNKVDNDVYGDDGVASPPLVPSAPTQKEKDQEMYTTRNDVMPNVEEGGNENEDTGARTTTVTNVGGTTYHQYDNSKDLFHWKMLDWGKVRSFLSQMNQDMFGFFFLCPPPPHTHNLILVIF